MRNVEERILTCRLLQMMKKNPQLSEDLGLIDESTFQERPVEFYREGDTKEIQLGSKVQKQSMELSNN